MTQRLGRRWGLEDIKDGLDHFYNEHGRYPTSSEVDSFLYLPSSRTFQRSFGGLVELRKNINLSGQSDFRSGEHSRKRTLTITKRAYAIEKKVCEHLQKIFGNELVHREYFFTDDKRTRADFFVYDAGGGFCVDVFYPSDLRNLTGCLNSKLNKYLAKYMKEYPIIYLQMNEKIEQETMDKVIRNKTRKLPQGQFLMSWESFRVFCNTRIPLKIQTSHKLYE